MRKYLTLSLAILFIVSLGFIVGCEKKNPSYSPPGGQGGVAFIEMRLSQSQIRGFEGEVRSVTITAVARDVQGVAVSGAKTAFAILNPQPWKGAIVAPAVDTTGQDGTIQATYTVTVRQTDDVVVEARSGNVTGRATINVIVVNDVIGTLAIEGRSVMAVPPNTTRTTTVTASLTDTVGRAMQGMQIQFRVDPPGMGSVESDVGTTDINGRVTKTFTTIVNKFGFCNIIAQIGTRTAQTRIEIRPVAAPAYIKVSTPNPTVTAAQGADITMPIEAVITDSNRVGVPGVSVSFEVAPMVDGGLTYGAISARDTTDADGKVLTNFRSLGSIGQQRIRARVLPSSGDDVAGLPEISDSLSIEIKRIDVGIRTLRVTVSPTIMNLPPDSIGKADIRAVVLDEFNRAIREVQVNFTVNIGRLSHITITDSAGVASAIYRTDGVMGNTIAVITATIPGTNLTATAQIDIRQSQNRTGFLTLATDKSFIYADNGLTTAALTSVLKDEDRQALAGKQVIFTSTHGSVNSPVTTDSLGIARAIFTDIGLPSFDESGNLEPSLITVRYDALGLIAQVQVTILERNPVDRIALTAAASQMVAGRRDSTTVRATCFLMNDDFAPNGTLVRFEVDNGRFTSETVPVSGNYGVAETQYIAGNLVGTAHLRASVVNEDTTIFSNTVDIRLLPGPASRITVSANPRSIPTNDPNVYSTITAIVTDTIGNPIEPGSAMVRFTTSMGNISPPTQTTDDSGRAVVRLTSGVNAGIAEVIATVAAPSGDITGRTTVTFVSGGGNSIELIADPLQIAVAGTGQNSSSTLRATLRDPNGNLVETPTTIVFELLREPPAPNGCNINNRGQRDSTLTAAGIAVATLNAGTQIGGKLIRAYTWRDPATRRDTVSVTLSNVAVVAGPPFQLDIDVNDDGDDAGGGAWVVEVSARVWDIHRNPVANGIPVVFSVDPQIATISPGHTGNDGRRGEPTPGLAYADMVYNSVNTFEEITISADVQTVGGQITGMREHILAMQDGVLELNVDPANFMFDRGNPNLVGSHRVWVVLRDGHLIPINGAPILFTTNRSKFYWYNLQTRQYVAFDPEPARRFTGKVDARNNEPRGVATVFLRGIMDDYFLDPFTLEVTVQVQASVEGYNDVQSDPGFIFMTRH